MQRKNCGWQIILIFSIWTHQISGSHLKKFGPNNIAKAIELILLFSMKEQNIQSATCKWQHWEPSNFNYIGKTRIDKIKKTIRIEAHGILQKNCYIGNSTKHINFKINVQH